MPHAENWAPVHYSVLFEDPDGIQLELKFVSGNGLLAEKRRGSRPPFASAVYEGDDQHGVAADSVLQAVAPDEDLAKVGIPKIGNPSAAFG
jgi:hypothetical protein